MHPVRLSSFLNERTPLPVDFGKQAFAGRVRATMTERQRDIVLRLIDRAADAGIADQGAGSRRVPH
jgi:hypothetical protein